MDEMTKEELLSAYIDGEVTAEQRAYVEKLIETDAEAHAALEELRALSDSLKALPRLEVGEDLSERVLRRAERAILQQKPDETIAPAAASAASTQPTEKTLTAETVAQKSEHTLVQPGSTAGGGSSIGWGRRLAGPLAAIAAAVLIMVMSQNKEEEADLAQAPRSDVYTAPEPQSNEESAELSHRDEAFETDRNHAFKAAGDGEGTNGTATYRAPGEPGAPSMSAMRSPAKGANEEFYADRKAGSTADADVDGIADKLAKSEPTRGKLNDLRTNSQAPLAEQTDDFSQSGQPASGGRNRTFTAQAPADGSGLGTPGARRGAFGLAGKKDASSLKEEADQLGAEPQLVVDLVISSAAMESGAFDELLARQNIHFDSAGENLDQLAIVSPTKRKNRTLDQQELEDAAPAAELAQTKTGGNLKAAAADNDKKRNLQKKTTLSGAQISLQGTDKQPENELGSESNESVELVYVVASASQVQAALQEMQQQSQNYLAYSIEPQSMTFGNDAHGPAEKQVSESKREAEHEGPEFGKQSTLAEAKKASESQAEKMPRQSAPAEAGNLDSNTRPSATLEAETASPAKLSAGAKPAPAPPQDRSLNIRGQEQNSEGERRDLQSGGYANRAAQQLPAGRAQRVQIPADELSRWRENPGWNFSAERDALPAQELAANERTQQIGQSEFRSGKGGGGQTPAGEETQSFSTDPAEVRPDTGKAPSATSPAPELSKEENQEREPKPKNAPLAQPTPAEEPAPPGAAEPPASKDAEPPARETTNALSQTQTFEQGEKSVPAMEDAPVQYWESGDIPPGLREDDLVRVLFVVRGARINHPNLSKGQTGTAAATEAAETERSAPEESPPRNKDAPGDDSPAPNASPADEE